MKRNKNLPTGALFQIDLMRCQQSAPVLKELSLTLTEARSYTQLNQEQYVFFKLAFISICHQFNWEVMESTLYGAMFQNKSADEKDVIRNLTPHIFKSWFKLYPRQERIKATGRVAMLKNLVSVIDAKYEGSAMRLIEDSHGYLYKSGGLIHKMDQFEAYYEDPLRKKSNVLIHELIRERRFEFKDVEKAEPAIDYHIMRAYLRTQRVYPQHKATRAEVQGLSDPRGRLVLKLRQCVAEALKITAGYAGITVPDLNYIEWQLARNICLLKEAKCIGVEPGVQALFAGRIGNVCPFAIFCSGPGDGEILKFQEPVYNKTYY